MTRAKIAEIFKSIQGEGPYQGVEQVFLRFFGCNLKCQFCDTNFVSYREVTVEEVLSRIADFEHYHSISLTGGEPLLQIDFLKDLSRRLKKQGKAVYLETNGTLPQNLKQIMDSLDIIAMDFKLSSSTGMQDFWAEHREFLEIAKNKEVFIKAVIGKNTQTEDLRRALSVIEEIDKAIPFILQPENPFEEELENKLQDFAQTAREIIADVRVIAQLHKKIGVK